DRRFAPTPLGETVWQVMKRSFPDVFEVGFTAQMEDELDKVEEGDLAWQQVLGDFWGPFAKALDAVDVQKLIHDVHDLSNLHKEKCPTCGSGLWCGAGGSVPSSPAPATPTSAGSRGRCGATRCPTGPPTRSARSAARRW